MPSHEAWLWGSADILRGSIDNSDFKNYIFSLLFLKRANDVFQEETENLVKEENMKKKDAESDPDYHQFFLPKISRWKTLIEKTENIGEAIDEALAAIEKENTNLEGVMTAVHFGNKEVLSDTVLQRLLHHFNKYSPKNKDLYTPDLLSDAYEYLIKMFADDAGKKGGDKGAVRQIVKDACIGYCALTSILKNIMKEIMLTDPDLSTTITRQILDLTKIEESYIQNQKDEMLGMAKTRIIMLGGGDSLIFYFLIAE